MDRHDCDPAGRAGRGGATVTAGLPAAAGRAECLLEARGVVMSFGQSPALREASVEVIMALITQTYAEQVGQAYAEVACGEKVVRELWVSTVPGEVRLWLLTEPIDAAKERDLHRLTGKLYDKFGKADFVLHVVNPPRFRGDARNVIPPGAMQIPLDPA